jgi:hypothetical protein
MLCAGFRRKPGDKTELAQAEGTFCRVVGQALRKFLSNASGDNVRPESSRNVETIVHYRGVSNNILDLHVPAALLILSSGTC